MVIQYDQNQTIYYQHIFSVLSDYWCFILVLFFTGKLHLEFCLYDTTWLLGWLCCGNPMRWVDRIVLNKHITMMSAVNLCDLKQYTSIINAPINGFVHYIVTIITSWESTETRRLPKNRRSKRKNGLIHSKHPNIHRPAFDHHSPILRRGLPCLVTETHIPF